MKAILLVLLALTSQFCFSTDYDLWIIEDNKKGGFVCQHPDKHEKSGNYSILNSIRRGWKKCEVVPLTDRVDEQLHESIGKVIRVKGSYVIDDISISRRVERMKRYFVRGVTDTIIE